MPSSIQRCGDGTLGFISDKGPSTDTVNGAGAFQGGTPYPDFYYSTVGSAPYFSGASSLRTGSPFDGLLAVTLGVMGGMRRLVRRTAGAGRRRRVHWTAMLQERIPMMWRTRMATRGLAAAITAVAMVSIPFVRPAQAATWTDVYYELNVSNSQTGSTSIAPTHVQDPTGAPVSMDETLGAQASVWGSAFPGLLKVGVWSAASVGSLPLTGVSDEASVHGAASFFDQITILPVDTSLMGQTATINARLLVEGSMLSLWHLQDANSPYYDAFGRVAASVSGTGISGFVTGREIHGRSSPYPEVSISEPLPLAIPLAISTTFGSVTGIQYNLDLQGSASAAFGFRECGPGWGPCGAIVSAVASGDYSNTVAWGGITSVTDANGNPIAFSVSSSSGTDYGVAVVPLPTTLPLLLTALGSIGWWRRARRG